MENLLVMKFGGTSVGSAERMKAACDLIARYAAQRPVTAVVSAMSKITDLLLDTTRLAEADDQAAMDRNMDQLAARHLEAAKDLVPAAELERVTGEVKDLVAEFQRIVNGMQMLGYRPARAVDEAIAVGERLSALLVSEHLRSRGISAEAVNAAEAVVTDSVFNAASPLMDLTQEKAQARLMPILRKGGSPIVTGFNGATVEGWPTTLGRGGSDFSASILAAALNATELWIWTDVDGIMTADPRLVPDAKILDEITYSEAAELAWAGAKVLHPRTIAPLVERGIPVWSKNSFSPEKPGTCIVPRLTAGNSGAKAVTSMANVALVSLEPASAAVSGVHLMARSLDALDRVNVEILALSSSSYRQSFCFLVRNDEIEKACDAIRVALSLEFAHGYVNDVAVDRNVGLLAVVGEGMRGAQGLAGRIFTAISREKVNVIAIAQGSSELTISIAVRKDGLEKAVRAVHAECHL
ncbi:MAG TPA: aspartate kinase [Bryobacteraceae bacterium]|nr:aspartate kinase [Bryobacteraceae bacterium]